MSMKNIKLIIKSGQQVRKETFTKSDLIIGSSEAADVHFNIDGMLPAHCRTRLDGESLVIESLSEGNQEPVVLNVGDSINFGEQGEFSITFESLDLAKAQVEEDSFEVADAEPGKANFYLKLVKEVKEKSQSTNQIAEVRDEALSLISTVKRAEARMAQNLDQVDYQLQNKISQSNLRAHQILQKASQDIEELTSQAQKKVFHLNDEITAKTEQLQKTIFFLEGEAARKQSDLNELSETLKNLEARKTQLHKDVRIKENEFETLQSEFHKMSIEAKNAIELLNKEQGETQNQLDSVRDELLLEEKKFEEKSYILNKRLSISDEEIEEKHKLIEVLKSNYLDMQNDLEQIKTQKDHLVLKVSEQETLIKTLDKKKELIEQESKRILARSKNHAQILNEESVRQEKESSQKVRQRLLDAQNEAMAIVERAKKEAKALSEDAHANAQELVEMAALDAEKIVHDAHAKKESAELEYDKRLKSAETKSIQIIQEAQKKSAQLSKEWSQNQLNQQEQFEQEIEDFKNSLNTKSSSDRSEEVPAEPSFTQDDNEAPREKKSISLSSWFNRKKETKEEDSQEASSFDKPEELVSSNESEDSFAEEAYEEETIEKPKKAAFALPSLPKISPDQWKFAGGVVAAVGCCVLMVFSVQQIVKAGKENPAVAKKVEDKGAQESASIATEPKSPKAYHSTYADRVLYTEQYVSNEFQPSYRSKWIQEVKKFIVEELGLPEAELANVVTSETALIRALDQMRKKSGDEKLMRKLETKLLDKMKSQLGSQQNLDKFFKIKSKFYKNEFLKAS